MDEVGCVHGRFQHFHNDHLSYVQAAKQMVKFVWIGIAKFDIAASDANPLGRDRDRPENNPLTYFERISMISEALTEAGMRKDEFGFVPFPIETPLRLSEFMPPSIPCYTTICEE
jgi:nicotinamide mononucleotide adenylyltransferase